MSSSLSIFQKLCPSCASSLPVGAARCDCGHEFESDGPGSTSAEEASLRDEELYENYLVARAAQAQEAASAAQDAVADDPGSQEKNSAAELAREVARSIQSDLAEQRRKVEALRATIRTVTPAAPAAPKVSAQKTVIPSAVATSEARPPARAPRATPKTTPASVTPPPRRTVAARPSAIPAPTATVPRMAMTALEAIKQAKARAVARLQKNLPTVGEQPAPAPGTVTSQEPMRPVEAPMVTNVPPPTFRAEQAARADKVMGTQSPETVAQNKDCPNCTASVPTTTTRCRCGFVFATGGNDLPTLTLCTGDFTALRNSLNLHLRSRS